ncbi:Flp pilus assembly protein TadD, contains TPR repeats [Roseibium album]|nr:Flp pilus assembly protein TadD, contains TPR repeats [Roseibium album]
MTEAASETKGSKYQSFILGLVGLVLGFLGGSGGMVIGFYDRLYPENKSPTANLVVHPDKGEAPHQAFLIASGSSDPEGGTLQFDWTINSQPMNTSEPVIEYTFDKPGIYAVNVMVHDAAKLEASMAKVIEVKEAFDRLSFLQTLDGIHKLIQIGDFVGAIDIANSVRFACGNRIPKEECAKIHQLAAEAHRNRGEFAHGVSAMENALELHPADVIYKVDMAIHYLLVGEGGRAIEQLEPLLAERKGGPRVAFYAALATAMEAEYDKAMDLLSPVRNQPGRLNQVANFTHLIVDVLSSGATEFLEADKMRAILCDQPHLKQLIIASEHFEDAHVQSLHVMIHQLSMQDQSRLKTALENSRCT